MCVCVDVGVCLGVCRWVDTVYELLGAAANTSSEATEGFGGEVG